MYTHNCKCYVQLYCCTAKRGTTVLICDSNSSSGITGSCGCVCSITLPSTRIHVCSMSEQKNVWDALAPYHKPPPLSPKILVAGKSYCRLFPCITMETHEDTMKLNHSFFSILAAGTVQKCPVQTFKLGCVRRLWLHVDVHLLAPGSLAHDGRGCYFWTKLLYGLLSDKADIHIQRKHIRKVVLLRITQSRLLQLICIQMVAGRSYRENREGFHTFNFSRRCDIKAIML